MNEYINNYEKFNKKLIYNFKLGFGGIGDCIKFFMHSLNLSIKYNFQLYYLINNIPVEKYIKLKYPKMYINVDDVINDNTRKIFYIDNDNQISEKNDLNYYYVINPFLFYNSFTYDSISITINIDEVFEFSNEIIINSKNLLNNNNNNNNDNILDYISIHLRLGDKYLETDKAFVMCINDERQYNEDNLFKFIEENINKNKNIIFFCDNNNYKLKIKKKYQNNNFIIIDSDIGHTSLLNTTEKQTLDTISEFYILTNSKEIYSGSYSGFSIIASKFKNIPLKNI
jgi:hypothetical protein